VNSLLSQTDEFPSPTLCVWLENSFLLKEIDPMDDAAEAEGGIGGGVDTLELSETAAEQIEVGTAC